MPFRCLQLALNSVFGHNVCMGIMGVSHMAANREITDTHPLKSLPNITPNI